MSAFIQKWLISIGVSKATSIYITKGVLILLLLIISYIVNLIAKKIFLRLIKKIISKTKTQWDDVILKKGVVKRFARIIPAVVIYLGVSIAFADTTLSILIKRFAVAYMIGVSIFVLISLLDAINFIYKTFEISRKKPITGYVQIVKIFLYILGFIFVITTLMNKSPWGIISGIGAMTAIILLVFKDTILGFVASIQINSNHIVEIGDPIEVPNYNADGEVIDITLHTVKIQNWDNTITSIPTYSLITSSFKNWRGMKDSGGRRIKRAFYIDKNSIKLCTDEMLNKFENYNLVSDYIKSKTLQINDSKKQNDINSNYIINCNKITNLEVFREYIKQYLIKRDDIREDMTLVIRNLEATHQGLPVQVYCFSSKTSMTEYELIQSEIFDHIHAVLQEFDLRIFQYPGGFDLHQNYINRNLNT